MKKSYLLLLLSLLFVVQACDRNRPIDTPDVESEYFDFATTRVARVSVNYDVSFTSDYKVLFSVYDRDPFIYSTDENGETVRELNTELMPLGKAFTNGDGHYSGNMQFPTHVEKVYLYSNYIGIPTLVEAPVENGIINVDQRGSRSVSTKASPYDYTTAPTGWLTLGAWTSNGKPEYLLERQTLSANLLSAISNALPESKKINSTYLNSEYNDIDVDFPEVDEQGNTIESIEIKLTFLSSGGSYKNALAYYVYDTDNPPTKTSDIQPILAFPNAVKKDNTSFGHGELLAGDNIQLKYWNGEELVDKFPNGVSIGFVLVSNGFKNGAITLSNQGLDNTNVLYSNPVFNPDKLKQLITLRNDDHKVTVLGFEDQSRKLSNPKSDEDFNDILFIVDVVAKNAPPTPDPDPVVVEYVGTLAFEDLWPSRGDYDMNDLVIKYHSKVYINEDNLVEYIEDEWTPIHTGASFNNAFGYQIGVTEDAFASVPTYAIENSAAVKYDAPSKFTVLQVSEYPMEKDQELATYLLLEDANDFLLYHQDLEDPIKFSFVTEFADLMEMDGETLLFPPYNPFIIANVYPKEDQGTFDRLNRNEVHLVNYPPTGLARESSFGKLDDRSNPEEGLWYVSEYAFPWAILIPGIDEITEEPIEYRIPTEKVRIDLYYPRFSVWVTSGGTDAKDWYLH